MSAMSSLGRLGTETLPDSLAISRFSGPLRGKRKPPSVFFLKTRYNIPAKYTDIAENPSIPQNTIPTIFKWLLRREVTKFSAK